MKILVLGGYGFMGAEIMRALAVAGLDCVGLGRSAATGKRLASYASWIGVDMATLDSAEKWTPYLSGVDAVVNAAGALQDGARDNLEAIHHRSIAALVAAAEAAGVKRIVQISAPGADADASTAFMRTKAAGDAAVRASSLDWVILKPGLVIGRAAYGGTALLRMLAGFPFMTPLVHASARVQTVAIDDVADAVVATLKGAVPMRRDFDLVEDEPHTLREIVSGFRRQLGFAPAKLEPDLPAWTAAPVSALADFAGMLGWRSPLRSTALKVMGEDVLADPEAWRDATGRRLKSFEETLATFAGVAQDRIFARAQLAMPIMTVSLAAFWIVSGVVGWTQMDKASALIAEFGAFWSMAAVATGSFIDMLVGALVLNRGTARVGAVASVVVSLFYLFMGTIFAPDIWADPLGAYVKVIPAIALGLGVALLLEER